MTASPEPLPPYGSAHDLPSVVEMRQTLTAMKAVTLIIGRKHRQKFLEVERDMNALFDLVDRFYEVLGERHWVFTEYLPTTGIRALLEETSDPVAAEAGLIKIIADRLGEPLWDIHIRHEALRPRRAQLERARQHYLDGQWDSCTLVLVTVMDGFINDVEPQRRRGLHARDAEEMVAFDSLVGHHQGLTAVMPVFLKPCKRRQDDEVFEVYRHGIVHGTVVNYNNQVVATKAWNLLSAVVDWATATAKAAIPAPPKPGLREVVTQLGQHSADKRYRAAFQPWESHPGDGTFETLAIVEQARGFLESWQASRWGLVAHSLPKSALGGADNAGKHPLKAKQIYEHSPLHDFEITGVSFPQASVAVIHGNARIGGDEGPINIRWLHVRPDGGLAQADEADARWELAVYPPHTFMRTIET